MSKFVFFFIGTEAELIKVFPIMLALKEKQIPYKLVASGQNDLKKSSLLQSVTGGKIDLELSEENRIKKSMTGLFLWFFRTKKGAARKMESAFAGADFRSSIMLVHGDTISTVMGALIGKKLKMRVAHVEAGLRSHNILNPFPEEIDRMITSSYANIHFAPGDEPFSNLKSKKGLVVNTKLNTILDSLKYSISVPCKDAGVQEMVGKRYFVLVLHRQENLMNKSLVNAVVDAVIRVSQQIPCIFILHKPTEIALRKFELMDAIEKQPNIRTFPRVEYFDFMKLLSGAQFVITDGGSNQEELCYMGKPCLILRTNTERKEGLGSNAVMYGGDLAMIDKFLGSFAEYVREPVQTEVTPVGIITQTIIDVM